MLDISFLFASPLVVVDRSARNFLPPLDVHSDCGALREACHDADWGVKARFEVATRTSMQRSVVRGTRLLHFSGHGESNYVYFESEDKPGEADAVTHQIIRQRLIDASSVRVVFVCACHSAGVSNAFLDADVPHVIAVNQKDTVRDKAAILFSSMFYYALLTGRSVADAFENGVAAVGGNARAPLRNEHRKFQLLPEGADHSEVVFPPSRRLGGSVEIKSSLEPEPDKYRCLPPCRRLVGRRDLLAKLLSRLPSPAMRVLQLCGPPGVGKTLVAHRLAEYLVRRGLFHQVAEAANFELDLADGHSGVQSRLRKATCGHVAAGGNEDDALRALRHTSIFLVVDGVPAAAAGETARAINQLLKEVPLLKIVVTAEAPVVGPGSIDVGFENFFLGVHPEDGASNDAPPDAHVLQPHEVGELFHGNLIQRSWEPERIGLVQRPYSTLREKCEALAASPVLAATRGHPGTIVKLAMEIHRLAGVDEALQFVRRTLSDFHPSRACAAAVSLPLPHGPAVAPTYSRTAAHGSRIPPLDAPVATAPLAHRPPPDLVPWDVRSAAAAAHVDEGAGATVPSAEHMWHCVAGDLSASSAPFERVWAASTSVYDAFLGPEMCRKRQLSREKEFFLSSHHVSPLSRRGDTVVSRERFSKFWTFFAAWLQTVQKVKEYWTFVEPPLLYMMTREQAIAEMRGAAPYTFLTRFSESRKGCLAMTLNYAGDRQESVLVVPADGGFTITTTRRETPVYPTLTQLVSQYQVLQYLPTGHNATSLFAHAANSARAPRTQPSGSQPAAQSWSNQESKTADRGLSRSSLEEKTAENGRRADPRPDPEGWGTPGLAQGSVGAPVAAGAAAPVSADYDVELPPAPPSF